MARHKILVNATILAFSTVSWMLFKAIEIYAQDQPIERKQELILPSLIPGIYSNGSYHYLQVSENNGRVCIQIFLDRNAISEAYEEAIVQIQEEAVIAIEQLEVRLEEEVLQQRRQLEILRQNESLLDQAIQSGQLPAEVVPLLDNPEALDQFLEVRVEEARQRILDEIQKRRIDAEQGVREASERERELDLQGIASVSSNTPTSIFYRIDGTDLVILPQEGNRLLFGQLENLRGYFSSDFPLSIDPSLSACLESQGPFTQIQL